MLSSVVCGAQLLNLHNCSKLVAITKAIYLSDGCPFGKITKITMICIKLKQFIQRMGEIQ